MNSAKQITYVARYFDAGCWKEKEIIHLGMFCGMTSARYRVVSRLDGNHVSLRRVEAHSFKNTDGSFSHTYEDA